MNRWVLPTISEVLASTEPELTHETGELDALQGQAEWEWQAAIAAMTQLLKQSILPTEPPKSQASLQEQAVEISDPQGIVLAGPMPVLSDQTLLTHLQAWLLTPDPGQAAIYQLPPSSESSKVDPPSEQTHSVPLLPADPIAKEQFCLVLTRTFSWIAVLRETTPGKIQFLFSFVPETINQSLAALKARVHLTRPHQLQCLTPLIQTFLPIEPDYRIPLKFSRQMLKELAGYSQPPRRMGSAVDDYGTIREVSFACDSIEEGSARTVGDRRRYNSLLPFDPGPTASRQPDPSQQSCDVSSFDDIKFLKAISHEIRTPLTTIQTFTRLLLKRTDLPDDVLKRLQAIQRECRQQIDRFSLIFRAMEVTGSESQPSLDQLTSISLQQVLEENIPRWRQQAIQRKLTLRVKVPEQLPVVVLRDPTMLEQVLTGLIERLSHSLPVGSEMELQVSLAGEQLKLQLRSGSGVCPREMETGRPPTPMLQAVGQLLMLQPETGGLSLSLPATKHLFQALGGKLTVRHHQQQGEVLTIFLPLRPEACSQDSHRLDQ